jgi:hypothetical protein
MATYLDLYEDDRKPSPWESASEDDHSDDQFEWTCLRCPADASESPCSKQSWSRVRKTSRHSLDRLRNQVYSHLRSSGLHEDLSNEECKQLTAELEYDEKVISREDRKKERHHWHQMKEAAATDAAQPHGAEPKSGKRAYSAGKSSGSHGSHGQKRQQTEEAMAQATATMQGALAALTTAVAARPRLADDDQLEIVPRSLAIVPHGGLSPEAHTARVNVSLGDLQFVKDQIDRSALAVNCASRTLVDSVRTLQTHSKVLSEVSDSLAKIIRKSSTPTTILK